MNTFNITKSQIVITLLLLLLVGIAFYLFLSLLSYDPADASWSQTARHDSVQNLGGVTGAYVADLFLQFLGFTAFSIPIFAIMIGLQLILYLYQDEPIYLNYFGLAFRLIGLSGFIMSGCGLCSINIADTTSYLAGGNIGDIIAISLLSLPSLSPGIASFFLLLICLGSFSLIMDFSWLYLFDKLGESVIRLTAIISYWVTRLFYKLTDIDSAQRSSASRQVKRHDTNYPNPYGNNQYDYDYEGEGEAYVKFDKEIADDSYDDNSDDKNSYDENATYSSPREMSKINLYRENIEPNLAEASLKPAQVVRQAKKELTILTNDDIRQAKADISKQRAPQSTNAPQPKTEQVQAARVSSEKPAADQKAENNALTIAEQLEQLLDNAKNEALINQERAKQSGGTKNAMDKRTLPLETNLDSPLTQDYPADLTTSDEDVDYYLNLLEAKPEPKPVAIDEMTPESFLDDSAILDRFNLIDNSEPIELANLQLANINEPLPTFEVAALDDDFADSLIHPLLKRNEVSTNKPMTPLPSLDLLTSPPTTEITIDHDALREKGELIEQSLADFRVKTKVVDYQPGPVITRFEIELAPGIKASRISTLDRDLARSLSMPSVRVVEVIPGKPYVGIELPNENRQTVYFKEVLDSQQFNDSSSPLTIVLGKDISGQSVVADLAKMPHVLVAGTTGSGKSVGVNAMILSILYKSKPEDVRFIMIDPKMLELSIYEGIPHLLTPVVTDMKDAANALNWCINEMELRYRLMSALGVRNIAGYNEKIKQAEEMGRPIPDPLWKPVDSLDIDIPMLTKLPYIVVMVDEFADLIMAVGKKVEDLIARLAQKARAAGIHLVLATQRPSVDVITGLIKANIPTRIAFTVSSKIDSRTILDQMGAESLLGMGDMLYLPPNSSIPIRVHGAFVQDEEVHAVVQDWKARGEPKYIEEITAASNEPESSTEVRSEDDLDPLFDQVADFIIDTRQVAVTRIQRKFFLGYNRAARIMEQMERQGIVSSPNHRGNREILVPPRS